jgi:hypothetical protein
LGRSSLASVTYTRPPAMTGLENPGPMGTRHEILNPAGGNTSMTPDSFQVPSRLGPRHWGQSSALPAMTLNNDKRSRAHQPRAPRWHPRLRFHPLNLASSTVTTSARELRNRRLRRDPEPCIFEAHFTTKLSARRSRNQGSQCSSRGFHHEAGQRQRRCSEEVTLEVFTRVGKLAHLLVRGS